MSIGLFELLFVFFALGVGGVGSIFWIWTIIDCATKEAPEGNDKLVWTVIIVFTHFIGAAIYFFVRRPVRIATLGV